MIEYADRKPLTEEEHALRAYDLAISGVIGTPYGVYVISEIGVLERVKPRLLHKNKMTEKARDKFVRKATTESYYLREKLLEEVKE